MLYKRGKLILASSSPQRAKILRKLGFRFIVHPPRIREKRRLKNGPANLVKINALRKAKEVAKEFKKGIVVGMDTIVYMKRKVIGKPRSLGEARKFLKIFTLYPHWVYTGIAIIDIKKSKILLDYEKTKLIFHKLREKEIDKYLSQSVGLNWAGGIDIDGKVRKLVKEIRGDYYNIVGFPLQKFLSMIRKI